MTDLSATSREGKLTGSGINWGWLLALGILLTVLGIVGLGMTYMLTLVTMVWLGVLAVIAGVAQLIDSFHHKGWRSIAWHLLIALVYVAVGVVLIALPVASAFWLTVVLAVSLAVVGVLRIVMAFQMRGEGWGWLAVLVFGLLSILLAVLIYMTVIPPAPDVLATPEGQLEWLRSWGWVIGLFVAIELIMEGVALIVLAIGARDAQAASPSPA